MPNLQACTDRQTDRRTGRLTDGQTDGFMDELIWGGLGNLRFLQVNSRERERERERDKRYILSHKKMSPGDLAPIFCLAGSKFFPSPRGLFFSKQPAASSHQQTPNTVLAMASYIIRPSHRLHSPLFLSFW